MWIYACLASPLLLSCHRSDPASSQPEPIPVSGTLAATVQKNRAKWAAEGSANYQFNLQHSCFCLPDWTREVTIRVAEGSIVEMHYADDGKAVEEARWGSYETVEALFALIEQAIAADAAQIDTQFDSTLGYPTNLYIDRGLRIADSRMGRKSRENRHPGQALAGTRKLGFKAHQQG